MQHPFRFGSVFSCSLSLWLLCGGALLCARPAVAQPQVPGGQAGFGKGAAQAAELKPLIVAFRGEVAQLARTQPEAVAARVDGFLAAHPAIMWSDAALFLASKAAAQHKTGDAEAALQTYRAALAGFDGNPQKAWAAAELLAGEARVLMAQKDAEGAAQLLGDNWPLIALSNANRDTYAWQRTQEAVKLYVAALDAAKHKAQVPDILAGHLLQSPSLLEFAKQDSDLGALLLDLISQRLNKAKRGDEVASWARLRYATCRYEVEALDGATLFLGRAWNDKATARQFGAAQRGQTEAGAPNPLQSVEPPKLLSTATGREFVGMRAGEMEAELMLTGDAKLVPDLVSLYLASEQPGAAMEWAWCGAQANAGEPESIAQVCRVFKAADLDLVRAQQFVTWSGGKGENPVPTFLEQHANETNVGAATLKARRERKPREQATLSDEWEAVRQAPRGVLLGLVNLGALAPSEARAAGALEVDDTIRLIQEQRVRSWMSIPEREVIRLALAGVLEEQLAALPPKEQPDVPPLVQLALADSKRKRGDAGAVPIYEALIVAAEKRNEKGFDKQSIVPLAHLAMFYSETGQFEKSVQTWGRWKDMPTSDEWNADWRVQAGRVYTMAGEKDKAHKLYLEAARIPDNNYSFGAILTGLGRELQSNPRQAEEQLLQLEKEVDAPKSRLATQSLLAWARYKAKDWSEFLEQSQQALARFEKLDNKATRAAFAPLMLRLEEGRKWAMLWQKNSVVAEPSALDLRFDRPLQHPVERRIFVDTPTPTQLQVTVTGDTDRVSARLEESPWAPELAEVRHQQIVVVTIAPGAAQVQSLIRVAKPNSPQGASQIPLRVTLLH